MSPAFSSFVEAFKQDPDWAVKQAPDSQDLLADVSQNWKAYRESTDIHGLQSKYKSSLSRVSHGDVLRNFLVLRPQAASRAATLGVVLSRVYLVMPCCTRYSVRMIFITSLNPKPTTHNLRSLSVYLGCPLGIFLVDCSTVNPTS